MKTLVLCLIAVIAISPEALADAIRTNVVAPGDPVLTITVPNARVLTVVNFLSNGAGTANLAVTNDGKSTPILYPVDISSQGEIRRELVIAGPATVTVTTSNQPLVVTYRLDPNQ